MYYWYGFAREAAREEGGGGGGLYIIRFGPT